MTRLAASSLRIESDGLADALADIDEERAGEPSRCSGWSVKDVVCHLGTLFQLLCDPGGVPMESDDAEEAADAAVSARRAWEWPRVLELYATWRAPALDALDGIQERETVRRLGSLGTYPLHYLANAYAFDHYCHVRHDLMPMLDAVAPVSRALVEAAVEWIVAAAPQTSPPGFHHLPSPVGVVIDGSLGLVVNPSAGEATIQRVPVAVAGGQPSVVRSAAEAAILWASGRAGWEGATEIHGDAGPARAMLDTIHVF